ncbi:MAG: hypothetical protein A3D92_07105 [Bacteroidetes bacterium RIFCSPHIGHO2_02_FULL_44_7]|nr:MAG: hypothetical protein A3D92_07105 [Bacteroidetes bacterium RIFCSPHIGHO2_02_FULL_44_7]
MQEQVKIEDLTKSLKVYVQTNIELFKLEATERTSVFGANLISILVVGFSLFLFVLFVSLSAGFFLASYFNDNYTGFLLVTGFYFMLTIVLFIGRKKFIEKPIRDKIIRRILKK